VEFAACDRGCRLIRLSVELLTDGAFIDRRSASLSASNDNVEAIPRRIGQMVKRLLQSILISVMVVGGAFAISTYAQTSRTGSSTSGTTGATGTGTSGTGGSSTSGTGSSQGSSTSGSSTSGSYDTSGSASTSGSLGRSQETGTGGGADAG